jgi:hypothetical protein
VLWGPNGSYERQGPGSNLAAEARLVLSVASTFTSATLVSSLGYHCNDLNFRRIYRSSVQLTLG